jgi:hypothetical protein
MKLKPVVLSLFIVFFAFCAMGQSGCFDLFNPPLTPKASFPIGEFQGDLWIPLETIFFLGEQRIEERADGVYIIFPEFISPDAISTMTFKDGSVLKTTLVNRVKEGDYVMRITEADPDTGAPLRGIVKGSARWEMYTEEGQLIFLGTVQVPQRRYVFSKDGQTVEIQDEVPAPYRGVGIGIYAGRVLQAEVTLHLELRNGKPGVGGPNMGKIQ